MGSSLAAILNLTLCSALFNAVRLGECVLNPDRPNGSNSNYIHGTLHNSQVQNQCSDKYSYECFAKSLTKLLTKIKLGSAVPLLPGVHLLLPPPEEIHKTFSANNFTTVDQIYFEKLNNYLSSMSLRIQLFHPKTLSFVDSIQEKIFNVQLSEGRKKMKDSSGIIGVGLMFGGSALLMALSTLAVLAGKAIMTSIIALVLSAISGLSMLKGDDKSTTYEVVSRPIVSHGHSHTSEIQYENASQGPHRHRRSVLFTTAGHRLWTTYNRSTV